MTCLNEDMNRILEFLQNPGDQSSDVLSQKIDKMESFPQEDQLVSI